MEAIKDAISEFYGTLSATSVIVISIAIILFGGFLMTRLTKILKLPNVTAYILVGIIIGPCCLGLIEQKMIDGMAFIADIANAFIAFGVGEYFRLSVWKSNGVKAVIITLFESLVASVIVFLVLFILFNKTMALPYLVLLSSIAGATTPATTVVIVRQNKAKGPFIDLLLQVMALDIAISLVIFSISLSIVSSSTTGAVSPWEIIKPILFNIVSVILGIGFGFFLKLLMPKKRTNDNRLIIAIATLFAFCAISEAFETSPLLGCMAMGMTYINASGDEKLFKQLNYFSPPFLLLFFVRSGMNFDIFKLKTLGFIGLSYFIARIVGKYIGAFVGCLVTKKEKETRNYLGLALLPQASIAISLAAMCGATIGGEKGMEIQTIIVASALLNEILGPILTKVSLSLAKTYDKEEKETFEKPKILLEEPAKKEKTLDEIIEEHLEKGKIDPHDMTDEEAYNELIEENETYFNSVSRRLHTRK